MNAPLPIASRPTSTLLSVNFVPNRMRPADVPDREAADDADEPDGEHDHHDLAQRLAELDLFARAREAGELGKQRGLHRLEAEQRDTRDQDAGREVADEVGLRRRRRARPR